VLGGRAQVEGEGPIRNYVVSTRKPKPLRRSGARGSLAEAWCTKPCFRAVTRVSRCGQPFFGVANRFWVWPTVSGRRSVDFRARGTPRCGGPAEMGKQRREGQARWVQPAPASPSAWSNRTWSSECNRSVSSSIARFGTRPEPEAGGGHIGLPITSAVFEGRTQEEPTGIERSLPPMPTGTMGTLARRATNAGPRNSSWTVGPERRVPSGNRTTGSPAARARSHI